MVFIAVLIALFRGGSWQNLITFRFNKTWLVLMSIGIQIVIFNPIWESYAGGYSLTNIFYVASIVFLLYFIIINYKVSGLIIYGSGVVANGAAIIANGGYMPSSVEALEKINSGAASYNIVPITNETNLRYLCDIFYLPYVNVYSVGDILIAIGIFLVIQKIMLNKDVS
ncbi:MAG: DUF5317 domain-containing protein [Peptococcaceae bacterium]|nr:DUF5317 domain-containing protein [Peptococcaceae bacterium]